MAETISLDLGQKLMATLAINELMNFSKYQAKMWKIDPSEIFMSFKIVDGKPTAKVESQEFFADATERLDNMPEMGQEMLLEFLGMIDICAEEWKVDVAEMDMNLKLVDRKPELAIEHKKSGNKEVII